jgi:hypothetical protein
MVACENKTFPIEGLAQTKEELKAKIEETNKPITIDELIDILGSTVKRDNENKAIAFLCMTLTYTEEDQTNLGFLAESSTGKSYIPLELGWYFPKEDVIKLGYASPQTFFYEAGILIPDPSDNRDVEDDKRRKIRIVDLHQKILIFMDQPHDQLLQRLRPLLSHDDKKIVSKMVNKREKSGNRTETVVIEGFPTVIFCTAKFTMQDQEKTRLLLLSPEVDQEKLRESLILKIDKESDRETFQTRLNEDPRRQFLAARMETIKSAMIKHVNIPEKYRNEIYNQFIQQHKFLIPRHQRDISRLLAIIKGHALMNHMHRERIQDSIIANQADVEVGFRLYSSVGEANELGLSPELFNIYQKLKKHIEDSENGITRKDFQKFFFKEFHKTIGQKAATSILEAWANVGLVIEQPDPNDRRYLRYILPDSGVTSNDNQVELPHTPGYISPIISERLNLNGFLPSMRQPQTLERRLSVFGRRTRCSKMVLSGLSKTVHRAT